MDEKEKLSLLKDEYLHIQSAIESFDGKMLTFKSWSVSFSLTALSGAVVAGAPEAFLVASLSAFMFWLIEGYWKSFQYAYYDRTRQLEEFFAGNPNEIQPMQISLSWHSNWKKGGIGRLLQFMLWPHVLLPHAAILILGVVLYALAGSAL